MSLTFHSLCFQLHLNIQCTNFADEYNGKTTYKELTRGESLPYSTESLITSECVSCIEQEDPNRDEQDENGDEEDEGPQLSEQCERLYESAGKCESSINVDKSGMTSDPNNAACSYINGIQFTKTNGILEVKSNKTASFFIFMFAAAFIGLAGVVYKLRDQIKEAKASPLLEKEDSQEDTALN